MKLTIKRKGKVVGFVTWKNIGKPKHKLIELTRMEVDNKYRWQGIGTELCFLNPKIFSFLQA